MYQNDPVLILGIETSCDDTGVALYDRGRGELVAHAVHTQAAMHQAYGGVVPELASRDHVRRLVPLTKKVLGDRDLNALDGIGYTEGPGLAGALLVGASFAHGLALSLGIPAIGVHHLEGHLLSPLLSVRRPEFPFLALLVSGGHTQLMRVGGVGNYELLGDTLVELNEPREALAKYTAVVTQSGETPGLLMKIARLQLEALGLTAPAVKTLKRLLKVDPSRAEGHYYLGLALKDTGKTGEARREFEAYVKLAPEGEFANDARRYVDDLAP